MIECAVVKNDRRLVSVSGVDRAGRSDVDKDLVYFLKGERIAPQGEQIASRSFTVEPKVKQYPAPSVKNDAGITGKSIVPSVRSSIANQRITGVSLPGFEVSRGSNAALLVPAFLLSFRIIEEVVSAGMLNQAGFVEAAAFP